MFTLLTTNFTSSPSVLPHGDHSSKPFVTTETMVSVTRTRSVGLRKIDLTCYVHFRKTLDFSPYVYHQIYSLSFRTLPVKGLVGLLPYFFLTYEIFMIVEKISICLEVFSKKRP